MKEIDYALAEALDGLINRTVRDVVKDGNPDDARSLRVLAKIAQRGLGLPADRARGETFNAVSEIASRKRLP